MQTFRMIGMALIAVLMCVNFTSCSKDDDDFSNGGSSIPKNTIRYQTTDGIIVRFENEDVFGGAKIISNTYSTTNGYGTIEFASEVTAIEKNAFKYHETLVSITLPNSVVTIGEEAFYSCDGLTSITIPNSVTSIGNNAFRDCNNLKTVINLSSLTIYKVSSNNGYVGYYADKVINAPNGSIEGDFVWAKIDGVNTLCAYLGNDTELTLPENYNGEKYVIGDYAFYNYSDLTSVTIPNSVTSIEWSAFGGCSSLTSVTIPNSVTNIGWWAFSDCDNLTSITIPNSVTSIGEGAFENCSGLTSVTIGNGVTSIGEGAFWECSGLTSVYVNASTPPRISWLGCEEATLYVPKGSLAAYKVASGWRYFNEIKEF